MGYWKYYLDKRKKFWNQNKEGVKEIIKFIGGAILILMFIFYIEIFIIDNTIGWDSPIEPIFGFSWMIGNVIFIIWFLWRWIDYWEYKTVKP